MYCFIFFNIGCYPRFSQSIVREGGNIFSLLNHIMLLPFSRLSPWKAETHFKSKIIIGQKKHTFRLGTRWSAGKRIDFWDESPRNSRKNPKPSHIDIPVSKADYWKKFKNKDKEVIHLSLIHI